MRRRWADIGPNACDMGPKMVGVGAKVEVGEMWSNTPRAGPELLEHWPHQSRIGQIRSKHVGIGPRLLHIGPELLEHRSKLVKIGQQGSIVSKLLVGIGPDLAGLGPQVWGSKSVQSRLKSTQFCRNRS